MPEIRGHSLEIIEGRLTDQAIAEMRNGQLALATVVDDPKQRGVGELNQLHLAQQYTQGLQANESLPTHYPLTLQNPDLDASAQIEAFMPVLQGVKDAPPMMQVTGRILDFTVQTKTLPRGEDTGRANFAIADTAHMPAIVKLRQIVAGAEGMEYISQFKDLLAGNGDVFCIWEVGSMALKSVVSTTEVSPQDFLEVDAVPDVPSPEKDLKRPEDLTYDYTSTFTDLESYEDEALKALIKPILDGLKNPDSKTNIAFLNHITKSIFNPNHEVPAKYRTLVAAALSQFSNQHRPDNPISSVASLAHSYVRATYLLNRIAKQESQIASGKLLRKSIPGEPTFKQRREKVWYELAHSHGFDKRIYDLIEEYKLMSAVYSPQNVPVFSRLRVKFKAHDDIDALIAERAQKSLEVHGRATQQAAILESFKRIDFYGQRQSVVNFIATAIGGAKIRQIDDVHMGAEVSKSAPVLSVSSDNSQYNVVTPPYYPTDVVNAFGSYESSDRFINPVPGVVARFQVILPEIDTEGKEQSIDSRPPLLEEFPREYIVTSAKYQPWAVSEFILNRMYGTKGKYHELREAIKAGTVSWQSILEQPRTQSWTILAEKPITDNPQSRRDVVAIDKPFVNGDAFLMANDDNANIYTDRGKVKGQNPRARKLGIIAKKGIFESDKQISRPTYKRAQSAQINRHQLEVIFAANSVFAKDGATGSEDQVRVHVPRHWKRVIKKRRKGIEA